MPQSSTDQTRFATEEPMFENMVGLPPEEHHQVAEPKKPLLKRKEVIIGIIVAVTFIVIISLFVVNQIIIKNRTPQVVHPENVPVVNSNAQNDPLIKKLTELKSELRSADPNQVNYAFPSVNLDLAIDN